MRVTLVDENDSPIANATVARLANDSVPREATPIGKTDADGTITLDVDPLVRTGFLATAEGRAAKVFGFFGGVPRQHVVTITKPSRWAGRVVRADGTPAAGATVELVNAWLGVGDPPTFRLSSMSLLRSTRADADGRFAFEVDLGLSAPNVLRARDATHASRDLGMGGQRTRSQAAEGTLELRLDRRDTPAAPVSSGPPAPIPANPMTIELNVVDDATGEPVRDFFVTPGGRISVDQLNWLSRGDAFHFVDEPAIWNFNNASWAYFFRVSAKGYADETTRLVKSSERQAAIEVRLKRETIATLKIATSDAAPAADARVYIATPMSAVFVPVIPMPGVAGPASRSDAAGIARVSLPNGGCRVAVAHDAGWAEFDLAEADRDRAVTLTRWATSTVQIGDGRAIGGAAELDLNYGRTLVGDASLLGWMDAPKLTDASGKITLNRLREGVTIANIVAPPPDSGGTWPNWSMIEGVALPAITPGGETHVDVATSPTHAVARLAEVPGAKWGVIRIEPLGRPCVLPVGLDAMSRGDRVRALKAAMDATPAPSGGGGGGGGGGANFGAMYVPSTPAGTVSIRGLPAGTYELSGPATTGDAEVATVHRSFVVPSNAEQTIDLGLILPTPTGKPALAKGDAAPPLVETTLDGKPFDLAGLKGKWVLLDFWGTWCGFCIADEPAYRNAFEGWGRDGRLTMVSLAVDDTAEKVREHLKTHALPWTHVVLGDHQSTDVPKRFGVQGFPTLILVSPEGKVVDLSLSGSTLNDGLARYIGPPAAHK